MRGCKLIVKSKANYAKHQILPDIGVYFFVGPVFAGPREDLTQALTAYFQKTTSVQTFEFLRDGPTVAGIAFPKYYLWVEGQTDSVAYAGAIRVADQNGLIVVTDFLSAGDIANGFVSVDSVFPKALISTVNERASAVILE